MHDVGDTQSADALSAEQLLKSLISQCYLTRDGSTLPDWLKQGFGLLESGVEENADYVKAVPNRADRRSRLSMIRQNCSTMERWLQKKLVTLATCW